MKDHVYFGSKKYSFKGNTHLHTTMSDGNVSPETAVQLFKDKGYQFIAWSDHDVYGITSQHDTDDFITIGGMERGGLNPYENVNGNDNPGFHFGCIEDPTVEVRSRYENDQHFTRPQKWYGDSSVTECIHRMEAHGNLVVLNHPEWHMTTFDTMLKNDYFAVEIFNYATEWSTVSSYGTAYWDHALQNGKRLFAIAADDVHEYTSTAKTMDYTGGFIVVNADHLDKKSIVSNMKAGNYYSSSGPRIERLEVKNNIVHVECSPCKLVVFKSWPERSDIILNRQDNAPVTSAEQKIGQYMKYIRVECIDFDGNVAWSNPIFIDD